LGVISGRKGQQKDTAEPQGGDGEIVFYFVLGLRRILRSIYA